MDAIRNNNGNLTTKRGNRLLSGWGGWWGAALVTVRARFAEWRLNWQTLRQLQRLDDRDLEDIGMRRPPDPGDIRGIAEIASLLTGPRKRSQ